MKECDKCCAGVYSRDELHFSFRRLGVKCAVEAYLGGVGLSHFHVFSDKYL